MSAANILSASQVLNALAAYKEHLSPADEALLRRIAPLLDAQSGQASAAAVLAALFPDDDAAVNKLSKLCARLATAAQDHGFELRLVQIGAKKLGAANRLLQFEGQAVLHSEQGLGQLAEAQRGALIEDVLAVNTSSPRPIVLNEQRDGKYLVRWFFSYAHADNPAVTVLFEELSKRLNLSNKYAFEGWKDNDKLMPGDGWKSSIEQALQGCSFGLLAVSYNFFNSRFVVGSELPSFVGQRVGELSGSKRAVPLLFEPLNFAKDDLKGLQELQFFKDNKERAYSQVRAKPTDRFKWIDTLRSTIEDMLDRHALLVPLLPKLAQAVALEHPSQSVRQHAHQHENHYEMGLTDAVNLPVLIKDQHAVTKHLQKGARQSTKADPVDSQLPQMEAFKKLEEWAKGQNSRPLCALLGEYGTGKTVTCQRLTLAMLEAYRHDPSVLPPLYFDLRNVSGLRQLKGTLPSLEAVIQECVDKGWGMQAGQTKPSAQALLALIHKGALVVFDGLDECLVHLSETDGFAFTRMLTSVLPVIESKGGVAQPSSRTRMLISCRTEFFKSFRDEQTQLTGQDRSDKTADMFEALQLLPLTPEQVRFYLQRAVGGHVTDAELDRFMAVVASVHNLTELTQRPYTLKLVAQLMPRIDALVASGQRVQGVTLYREMMLSLLERDSGKHQIDKAYKLPMAAHLAAHMWREGLRVIEAQELELWYQRWLYADELMRARYSSDSMDKLLEDLRNSSFLVRQDRLDEKTGETESLGFRFGHSSQLEYFLACYLFEALTSGQPERWGMPIPSSETLNFVGQLMQEAQERQPLEASLSSRRSSFQAAMATLDGINARYQPQASELAFAYARKAHAKGYPRQSLAGVQLPGFDWPFQSLAGSAAEPLLLRGANFAGAQLQGCTFEWVDFTGSDFSGARLIRTVFDQCIGRGAQMQRADATGCVLRGGDWQNLGMERINAYDMEVIRANLSAVQQQALQTAGAMVCMASSVTAEQLPHHLRVAICTGHAGTVRSVAYRPDGQQLASAGQDGSVRLWDAASGMALQTFATLPDGQTCSLPAGMRSVQSAGPKAWKYLRWMGQDPATGERQSYPAEMWGPLPVGN